MAILYKEIEASLKQVAIGQHYFKALDVIQSIQSVMQHV